MRWKKLNDHGSSLITVVLCMILITLLGMLIMNATMLNLKIKHKQKLENIAFYQCEASLNEIKTGIYQTAISSIEQSYLIVLENYTKKTKSDLYIDYYNNCVKFFKEAILGAVVVPNEPMAIKNKLMNYVVNNTANVEVEIPNNLLEQNNSSAAIEWKETDSSGNEVTVRVEPKTIVIKGLVVTYKKDDHTSKISTDFTVNFPALDVAKLDAYASNLEIPYKDYSIIAEDGIECKDGFSIIKGDIYAGNAGISSNMNATNLSLYSNNVITKGALTAEGGGSLKVGNLKDVTNIWAHDLVTVSTVDKTYVPTNLILGGEEKADSTHHLVNCYVTNDLTINAPNSLVKVEGNYVGYTTVSEGTPDESGSSIVLNGKNSNLTMKGDIFALGGYAYIAFQQNRLNDADNNKFNIDPSSAEEKGLILTGESVGVKSNQRMYLVPNEYMASDKLESGKVLPGKNPITYEVYQDAGKTYPFVDLNKLRIDYSDPTLQVTPLIYSNGSGSDKVVYFYLVFSDTSKAVDFLDTFISIKGVNWSDEISRSVLMEKIQIDNANRYSVGNMMDYKIAGDGKVEQNKIAHNPFTSLDKVNGIKVNELSSYYDQLTKILSLSTNPIDPSMTPFTYYVNTTKANTGATGSILYDKKILENTSLIDASTGYTGDYLYHMLVVNGDYTVDTADRGFIIATGDVTVKNNFQGIILANGKVTLTANANVTYDPEMIKYILLHADGSSDSFTSYLNINSSAIWSGKEQNQAMNTISLENVITVSNWKRSR